MPVARAFFDALLVFPIAATFALAQPTFRESDRIRIAEAFRIADQLGDSLWSDWHKAPFSILLVTADSEFLVRHPKPSPDFTHIGFDSLLQSDLFIRPRVYGTDLLATFPAVAGKATIVVGQPEQTHARRSTRWVLTLLHEHFHQLQYHQPNYYRSVQNLHLSRGDQSGIWMLNYPFPYDSASVSARFNFLARKLRRALLSADPEFTVALNQYQILRKEFIALLSEDDAKYFSFQLWQEGVARYTELVMAELIAREYTPTPDFTALADYIPFRDEARRFRIETLRLLGSASLRDSKRVSFYPFGAGEALLLDRIRPGWRANYFSGPPSVDHLFPLR